MTLDDLRDLHGWQRHEFGATSAMGAPRTEVLWTNFAAPSQDLLAVEAAQP